MVIVVMHCLGTVLTDVATRFSSASFVNTLKAADPLYTVVLAKYFLREHFTPLTYFSLLIIVGGVFLTCITEFEFVITGFVASIIANTCFPLRTTFTKKILNDIPDSHQVIFFFVSLFTFLAGIIPSIIEAYFAEDSLLEILEVHSNTFGYFFKALICHYLYNMISFSLLGEISALTYSVGNSVKRLIIIYASVLYFNNPVTNLNLLGSFIAVGGVFLYSYDREQRMKVKMKQSPLKIIHV